MGRKLPSLKGSLGVLAASTAALLPAAAQAACSGACLDPTVIGFPQIGVGTGLSDIIDTLSFIAGVLSAIFLILGGIRYATSEGSSDKVARAKQTLTYAVLGLILSILATTIVGFVIARGPQ